MWHRYLQLFEPQPLGQSVKIYVSANGFFRALGIARGIVLTWLMVQAEFGIYQLGLLLANALLPIMSLGLYEGIWRFVPEYETKGQLWGFAKYALLLALLVAAGFCAVFFVAAPWVGTGLFGSLSALGEQRSSELQDPTALTRVAAWCVLVLACYHAILAVLKGRRMFMALSAMEVASNTLFTILAVGAALLGQGNALTMLSLYALANLTCVVAVALPLLWTLGLEPNQGQVYDPAAGLQRLTRYSIWAGAGALAWQLVMLYPAWHLNRIHGQEVFASFSAMRVLTQFGHVACAAMSVAVASAVSKRWESDGRPVALDQLNTATKGSLLVVLTGCAVVAALKGLVILLFQPAYHEGEAAIPILLLFFLLAGSLTFITTRFNLIHKSRLGFNSWLFGCLAAVVSSVLLIGMSDRSQALVMTAWASVVGVSVALLAALVQLHRENLLPDRGTLILLAANFLLLAGTPLLISGVLAVVLLALSTSLILTPEQRSQLARLAREWTSREPVEPA